MEAYLAEQTQKTPLVNFDPATGVFELKGKSIPENSSGFYNPLFDWLEKYCQDPSRQTHLNIQLDYFGTASSKCILDIIKRLEEMAQAGKGEAVINWMYNDFDEDILEAGENYRAMVKLPFNLISLG